MQTAKSFKRFLAAQVLILILGGSVSAQTSDPCSVQYPVYDCSGAPVVEPPDLDILTTVESDHEIRFGPHVGSPTFSCYTSVPDATLDTSLAFVDIWQATITNADGTALDPNWGISQGDGVISFNTGQSHYRGAMAATEPMYMSMKLAGTYLVTFRMYMYGTSVHYDSTVQFSWKPGGGNASFTMLGTGGIPANGIPTSGTTGGSAGTTGGSTGTTGTTGGSSSSFDPASLFTMDQVHKDAWAAYTTRWHNMGPWGQIASIQAALATKSLYGSFIPFQTDFNYTEVGARATNDDNQANAPRWIQQKIPLPGQDFAIQAPGQNPGYVNPNGVGSPWSAATTLYGWRSAFRQILQWAFWIMFAIGVIQWLKGQVAA